MMRLLVVTTFDDDYGGKLLFKLLCGPWVLCCVFGLACWFLSGTFVFSLAFFLPIMLLLLLGIRGMYFALRWLNRKLEAVENLSFAVKLLKTMTSIVAFQVEEGINVS
jgi:hypothetical protein